MGHSHADGADDGGGGAGDGGAVGVGARDHGRGGHDNGSSADGRDGGGSGGDVRGAGGARGDSWVVAGVVAAETLEVLDSIGDVLVRLSVGVQAVVDVLDKGGRRAVAAGV